MSKILYMHGLHTARFFWSITTVPNTSESIERNLSQNTIKEEKY